MLVFSVASWFIVSMLWFKIQGNSLVFHYTIKGGDGLRLRDLKLTTAHGHWIVEGSYIYVSR